MVNSACILLLWQVGGCQWQGNRALNGSNWAAVRHCFNRRNHETRSRVAFSGERGKKLYASHFRSFSTTAGHFQPLPPIFAIWCPGRLAVSGDLKIGTAFNTAFRLEIRHEAWQEPSVIKTRLPWCQWGIPGGRVASRGDRFAFFAASPE